MESVSVFPWTTKRSYHLVLLPLGLALTPGCHKMSALRSDEIQVTGTVRQTGIEGGCWFLEADDSTRYELRPKQAPDSLLVDGARAVVVLKKRIDLMSTCQVGQIVDVVRVDSLRAGS